MTAPCRPWGRNGRGVLSFWLGVHLVAGALLWAAAVRVLPSDPLTDWPPAPPERTVPATLPLGAP